MRIIVNDVMKSPWAKAFQAYLKENPEAGRALTKLESANSRAYQRWRKENPEAGTSFGVDPIRDYRPYLLRRLRDYTASPGSRSAFARYSKLMVRKIAHSISCLEEAKRTCQSAEKTRADFEMNLPTNLQNKAHQRLLETTIEAIPEMLRALKELKKTYEHIANEKGELRNEESLVVLLLSTQRQLGRPHYSEIAYLLEAAFSAQNKVSGKHGTDPDVEFDVDKLKKIVKRFRERYPEIYNSMESLYLRAEEVNPTAEDDPTKQNPFSEALKALQSNCQQS